MPNASAETCRGPDIVEAAEEADLALVEELLRSDPSCVEKTDSHGRGLRATRGSERRGSTALHLASVIGHGSMVRCLLEARAAVDAKNIGGRRPQELRCDSCWPHAILSEIQRLRVKQLKTFAI